RGSTSSPLGWRSLAASTTIVLSLSKDGRSLDSGRLHAAPADDWRGGGRREEGDEGSRSIRLACVCGDSGREDRELLDIGRQRADVVDAGHGQQLAHLLEADLGLAAGHNAPHRLALDLPDPVAQRVVEPEALG